MARGPEAVVKEAVKKVLKKNNIWFFMPVQMGMGTTGIPDFVCCWAGRFFAIETKAPGKRNNTNANQKRVLGEIGDAGGSWLVVDDVQQLEAYLDQWEVALWPTLPTSPTIQ